MTRQRTRASDERQSEWNAHVRGAWVSIWLWNGAELTTRDIARLCGVSIPTAHRMMVILCSKMPITKTGKYWQWMNPDRDKQNCTVRNCTLLE